MSPGRFTDDMNSRGFDVTVFEEALDDLSDRVREIETKEIGGISGTVAPHDAEYVVMSLDTTLTNERQLAVTAPIAMVDGGAGSTVTLSHAVSGVGAGTYTKVTVDTLGHVTAGTTLVVGDLPAHDLLSATHGDTLASAVSRGSLIYGNTTPVWAELAHPGAAGYALVSSALDIAWDQTPAWSDLHSFAASIAFTGATGVNNIYIPDNLANALEFDDTGGTNYLRIETTDLQPSFQINPNGDNIDTVIQSDTLPLAFEVLGSTGQITLQSLGAGVVQSTAGGVLSSSTITVTDISDLAYAVPNLTLGVANAVGVANTVIRTDATILIFDAVVPNTIEPDDAAAVGVATVAARRDHEHAIVAAAPGANLTATTTNAEGIATNFARSDHSHAITNTSDGATDHSTILSSNASGQLTLDDLFLPNAGVVGIGAASERIEFYTAGYVVVDGANFGIGVSTPTELLVVGVDFGALAGTRISVGESGAASGLNIGEDANNRAWLLWDPTGDYAYVGTRDGGVTFNFALVVNDGNVGVGGITVPISTAHVYEDTATTTEAAGLTIEQDGAGDVTAQFFLTGGQRWVVGIDNSDGDKFKVASTVDLNTNARMTMTTGGSMGLGTTAPSTLLHLFGTGATALTIETEADANAPALDFVRANAGPAIIADDQVMASIRGFGYDGAGNIMGARIKFEVDGPPGINDIPGRILFETTADGAAAVSEVMRCGSDQRVVVGTLIGAPAALGKLHVHQDDATGNIPVIYLHQGDQGDDFFQFESNIGIGLAIETVGVKTMTTTHFLKVTLPGPLTRYIEVGTIA